MQKSSSPQWLKYKQAVNKPGAVHRGGDAAHRGPAVDMEDGVLDRIMLPAVTPTLCETHLRCFCSLHDLQRVLSKCFFYPPFGYPFCPPTI